MDIDLSAFQFPCNLAWSLRWEKYPETVQFLDCLHDQDFETGLISNWDIGCREVLSENGLLDKLSPLIMSGEVGAGKPDIHIFEQAFNQAGLLHDECLYVGEN